MGACSISHDTDLVVSRILKKLIATNSVMPGRAELVGLATGAFDGLEKYGAQQFDKDYGKVFGNF